MNFSSIGIIKKLKPAMFDYKDMGGGINQSGFIAQDVQGIIPNAVMPNPTDGYLILNMESLIPFMAKAIQELSEENEGLKNRIGALEVQLKK